MGQYVVWSISNTFNHKSCNPIPSQARLPLQHQEVDAFCVVVQQVTQQNNKETSYHRKVCRKWLWSGPLIVEQVGMKLVLVLCQ